MSYDGAELWVTFPNSKYLYDIKFWNLKTKKVWLFFKIYIDIKRIHFITRKRKTKSNKG